MQRTESQTSERVRALLADREISEAALARQLGLSQSYVSRRMRGDVTWRVDDIARIAAHLGVAVSDLVPSAPALT
jgi:transcriptional regulator with XRE-family HTH domain